MYGMTVTGSTYEDAVEEALAQIDLPRDALDFSEVGGLGEMIDDRRREETSGVTLRVAVRPEHVAEMARNHLSKILEFMDIEAEIRTVVDPDIVKVSVSAPASAILIGRNGETLDAIQHLINRMSAPARVGAPFVTVDVEDYRERRLARLEQIARKSALEAVDTDQEVEMEPMPRSDRKMIHMALRSNPTVNTFSRGDEGDRRVVIVPANEND